MDDIQNKLVLEALDAALSAVASPKVNQYPPATSANQYPPPPGTPPARPPLANHLRPPLANHLRPTVRAADSMVDLTEAVAAEAEAILEKVTALCTLLVGPPPNGTPPNMTTTGKMSGDVIPLISQSKRNSRATSTTLDQISGILTFIRDEFGH